MSKRTRTNLSKVSDEVKKQLVKWYTEDNLSALQISKLVEFKEDSVLKLLREHGVEIKTSHSLRKLPKFNEEAFLDITEPQAAYYYGWLLTDGWTVYNQDVIAISLEVKDEAIVRGLCDYIGYSQDRVFYRERVNPRRPDEKLYTANLKVANKILLDRLKIHGFAPNKSLKEVVPDVLLHNKYFWRGAFEGDGHISKPGGQLKMFICGGINICEKLVEYAKSIYPDHSMNIHISKQPLYYANSRRRELIKTVLDELYSGDISFRLERKYKLYLENFYGVHT